MIEEWYSIQISANVSHTHITSLQSEIATFTHTYVDYFIFFKLMLYYIRHVPSIFHFKSNLKTFILPDF